MPTLHPFFWKCHFGKEALCFRFDLDSLFFQDANMPPLNAPKFLFGIVIIVGRGIMLLIRLSQYFSSGCHHTTLTPKKIEFFIIVGRGIILLLDLAKYFFRVPPCHTYTQICFCFVIIEGRGIILLRLTEGISSGWHHATPTLQTNFGFVIMVGRGIMLLL